MSEPPEPSVGTGRVRQGALFAACLACCLPMLVFVGALSLGSVLAGGAALGVLVLVAGIGWYVVRRRQHRDGGPSHRHTNVTVDRET